MSWDVKNEGIRAFEMRQAAGAAFYQDRTGQIPVSDSTSLKAGQQLLEETPSTDLRAKLDRYVPHTPSTVSHDLDQMQKARQLFRCP